MDTLIKEKIKFWQEQLGLQDIDILTQPISREQVMFPNDISNEDRYFIGVAREENIATIYYDRELTEEDILHELLHVAFPEKSEEWVNQETNKRLR